MILRHLAWPLAIASLSSCRLSSDDGSHLAVADANVYNAKEIGALPPLPDGSNANLLTAEIHLRRAGYGSTLVTSTTTTLYTLGGPRALGPSESMTTIALLRDANGSLKWYRAFHPAYGEGYVAAAAAQLDAPLASALALTSLTGPAPTTASSGSIILSGHGDQGKLATGDGSPLIREVYWNGSNGAPVSQGQERYLLMAGATLRLSMGMPDYPDFSKLSGNGNSGNAGQGSKGQNSEAPIRSAATSDGWGATPSDQSSDQSSDQPSDGSSLGANLADNSQDTSTDSSASPPESSARAAAANAPNPFLDDPGASPTFIVYAQSKLLKIKGSVASRGYPFASYGDDGSGASVKGTYPDGTSDLDKFAFDLRLDTVTPRPCIMPNGQLHAVAFADANDSPDGSKGKGPTDTAWSLAATAAAAVKGTCFKYEVPFGQLVPTNRKGTLKAENWYNAHITMIITSVPQPGTASPPATTTIAAVTTTAPTATTTATATATIVSRDLASLTDDTATNDTAAARAGEIAAGGVDPDCQAGVASRSLGGDGKSTSGAIHSENPNLGTSSANVCGSSQHEFDLASPLVLHFAPGQPFTTTSVLASNAHFDLTGSGHALRTGWTGPASGLLALDRNGNGTIDDGTELFGVATRLKDGRRATNGYAALAQYDVGGKGYIDRTDPIFSKLVVWFNAPGDGLTHPGELRTLASLGVTRIDVRAGRTATGAGTSLFANDARYTAKFYGPAACGQGGCDSYDVYFRTVEDAAVASATP